MKYDLLFFVAAIAVILLAAALGFFVRLRRLKKEGPTDRLFDSRKEFNDLRERSRLACKTNTRIIMQPYMQTIAEGFELLKREGSMPVVEGVDCVGR